MKLVPLLGALLFASRAFADTPIYPVAIATADGSGTQSLTISNPPAIQGTDAALSILSVQNGGSINPPIGWNQVGQWSCAGGFNCQVVYYHIPVATEPPTYTWTDTALTNKFDGGIVLFRNVDQVNPIDNTLDHSTTGSTLNIPALQPDTQCDLALFAITTGGGGMTMTNTVPNLLSNLWFSPNSDWGADVFTFPIRNKTGYPLSIGVALAGGNTLVTNEVLIKPLPSSITCCCNP